MNQGLKISYSQVRDIASKIRAEADKVGGVFEQMKSAMSTMNTQETLQSDAGAQIKDSFDQLATKFEGFQATLLRYEKFLRETADAYEAMEQKLKNNATV